MLTFFPLQFFPGHAGHNHIHFISPVHTPCGLRCLGSFWLPVRCSAIIAFSPPSQLWFNLLLACADVGVMAFKVQSEE